MGTKILTYSEFKRTVNEEYHLLNCGHYLPESSKVAKRIKYDHEKVRCPKCGKTTFAQGIQVILDLTKEATHG